MYATSFAPRNPALRRYRYLLLAATLFTFLLMVVGTLVHTSQTGLACPDWPTCYGSFALPAGDAARLQITHRALAGLAALLMWVAAGWAAVRRIKRPSPCRCMQPGCPCLPKSCSADKLY
jgi:heme A synthase